MVEPERLGAAEARHHIPVLVAEVVAGLGVHSGGHYLDATVGGGGHSAAILEASAPDGYVVGLDRDAEAVERARVRLGGYGDRAKVVHASYVDLLEVLRREELQSLDGVLFDLGFSSWQIDDPRRGFSFVQDGPLDMRFDASSGLMAADLVNQLSEGALAQVLFEYGEEPRSRGIAHAIVRARPVRTTGELAEIVSLAVGGRRNSRASMRIHPATRTFQALRIAVNQELEAIGSALPDALSALRSGGRLAIIAFHSLEDRIVKQFLQRESEDCICPPELPVCQCDHRRTLRVLTRRPIAPTGPEIQANPRSRSAKLRLAEKL
jgi:16S rRNA (cytosine1402-N4)-methyltransferase